MSEPYQIMPPLTAIEVAELRASIEMHGVMVPVIADEHGAIIDGHHRAKLAAELGVPCPREVREGLSEESKRTLARTLNTARRHLTREQIRALITGQLRDTPERSDRQIAADLGVSNQTVSRRRKCMEQAGEVCQSHTTIGMDGKEQSRKRKPAPPPKKDVLATIPEPKPEPERDEPLTDNEAEDKINAVFQTAYRSMPPELRVPFADALNKVQKSLMRWCMMIGRVASEETVRKALLKQEAEMRRMRAELVGYRALEREWRQVIEEAAPARLPVENLWTLEEYRKIRAALHPDREPSTEKQNEAYKLFAKVDRAFEVKKRRDEGRAKAAATRAEMAATQGEPS